ncbi:MAG: asparagine synthase-related protein [Alphaproteobacteria bacterium]
MTFFIAYRGAPNGAQDWENRCRSVARNRRESIHVATRNLPNGETFLYGWIGKNAAPLEAQVREGPGRVHLSTLPIETASGEPETYRSATLTVDLTDATVGISAPVTSPEQLFYAQRDGNLVISSDCRLLLQPGWTLNPAAVFAVLQYGAIPAPLAIARDVKRVPPGQSVTIASAGRESIRRFVWNPGAAQIPDSMASEEVRRRLARVFPVPGGTPIALLFSGGVDSTLLADQLARDRHSDVTLVNYAFSDDDPESAIAEKVAAHYGYPFMRILHDDGSIDHVLARVGAEYSYPFGDVSTLPTNAMIHAAIGRISPDSLVIEGTGADAIFGLTKRLALWRRFTSVPGLVRQAAAAAYKGFGMWRHDGPVRKVCWLMRTRSQMPLIEASVMSQNSLDGIAYQIPEDDGQTLAAAIHDSYIGAVDGHEFDVAASMANLMHRCSGYCVAKSFDPIRSAGLRVLYPFLTSPIVDLAALMPVSSKYRDGADKYVLKAILKESLPGNLMDRPKAGFEPPMARYLRMPTFRAYLEDVVFDPHNPVLDYVDAGMARRMIEYSGQHDLTNREVHNYLWSLTFLSAWVNAHATP